MNTPVNAMTLQIILRALQLTIKEVYTFGLKFIAQVQGKQVQKIQLFVYKMKIMRLVVYVSLEGATISLCCFRFISAISCSDCQQVDV